MATSSSATMTSSLLQGSKRKTKPSSTSIAKRVKTKHVSADDLPWKKVTKPREADLGSGLDGFLELEEIEDVDVVFEETDGGRVVHFAVCDGNRPTGCSRTEHLSQTKDDDLRTQKKTGKAGESSETVIDKLDVDTLPDPVSFDGEFARHVQAYRT